MLQTIAVILVFLCIFTGIILVPLGLPGTWLIVLSSVIYSLFFPFDGGEASKLWVDGALLAAAGFGEIMEFSIGTFGGKALKVSNGAIISSIIGGLIGLLVGVPVFLIGSLLGLLLGAFLGAFIYELLVLGSVERAFKTAGAVLATRVVASGLKTVLAIGMGVYLAVKVF